jgi:hypothetical protein
VKPAEQLAKFVGEALGQGRSRADIADALKDAGWQDREVAVALTAWADNSFQPPVPRPQSHVSARDAFYYGLLLVALGTVVWFVNTLGFDVINLALVENYESSRDGNWRLSRIRWSVAVLVVATPALIWLDRRIAAEMRADPSRRRSAVARWFGYITLFIALLVLAGDAVTVIHSVLNGDMTLRFALKAGLVAVTAGLVLAYYRAAPELRDDI